MTSRFQTKTIRRRQMINSLIRYTEPHSGRSETLRKHTLFGSVQHLHTLLRRPTLTATKCQNNGKFNVRKYALESDLATE